MATSQGVTISVQNTASATTFITGQTLGTQRNNFTGFVGMAFTVGSSSLTITSLGRINANTAPNTHLVKLVQASNGVDVPGGSVSVSTGFPNETLFVYGQLASPVTLQANTSYYLLSQESSGGDTWYDFGPVTSTGVAVVNGPAYRDTSSGGNPYIVVSTLPNYAYVPVNFTYLLSSSPLSVTITAPQNGATLSGSVPVTVSTTGSVASVQLQINGQNVGIASTTSPYTNNLDTTAFSNGQYTLTAVASDGQGHSATSSSVSITVSNSSSGNTAAFVTGQTPGGARNNFTGFVGFAFTVGATPIQVASLGRIFVAGNSGAHLLKLVQASNGTDVAGGSVSLSMAGGTAGQYKYGALASPVTLNANTSYYVLSLEASGGDQWYDFGPITATNVAALNGPAYRDTTSNGNSYVVVTTLPNYAYGPLNFTYATGGSSPAGSALITGQTPGSARNNFNGFVGFAFTVGSNPLTVSSLGRFKVAANTGSHILKLVGASNAADVSNGSVTVSMAGGTAGTYTYGLLPSPVTLAANTTYYLLSLESMGADTWYDFGPVTATNAITLMGPAYRDTGSPGNPYNVVTTLPTYAYGPVNLIFQ